VYPGGGGAGAQPHTLHPAPCTLHPAPCTLHPENLFYNTQAEAVLEREGGGAMLHSVVILVYLIPEHLI